MADDDGRLEGELAALEDTLAGLEGMSGAFQRALERAGGSMGLAGREAEGLSRSMAGSLGRAFEGLVFDGRRLGDTLAGLGRSLSGAVLSRALAPVQAAVGGGVARMLGEVLPFARGAAFGAGRVAAFARGGVVDGPTAFALRGGLGLMGEAGPEAIVPLARGADGRLGIRSGGGGGAVQVTMHVTSPDVEGFRRSQSQIAAEVGRAIRRGQRNL